MHRSRPLLALTLFVACSSASQALEPKLLPRDLDIDPMVTCKACSECFGEGNLICSHVGCYNPDKGEQCCADAVLCVAKDNSCCEEFGGPGVSGTADGTPVPTESYTPSYTPTATGKTYNCYRRDSGQECCAKGDLFYCGGKFPNYSCYDPESQVCCDDGTVCFGEDCCDLVDAKPTNPDQIIEAPAATTTSSSPSITGGNVEIENPSATDSESLPTSSNVAAIREVLGGSIGPFAAGVLGLVVWL